jgi:adenine-specific DNA-methyltransferase
MKRILNINMDNKKKYGQYFTTDAKLRSKVISFIHNLDDVILEPSVGQGDLIQELLSKFPDRKVDMYEIDEKIKLLPGILNQSVRYVDFLTEDIKYKYKCIIGNPPYVKTSTGNLYIKFINKCFKLLDDNAELIFTVPSDVFKLTSMATIWNEMLAVGNITHIYHPNVENLFTNASIDVVIFRYEKSNIITNECKYNTEIKYIQNNNGLITFTESKCNNEIILGDIFDVYVGMVSGK